MKAMKMKRKERAKKEIFSVELAVERQCVTVSVKRRAVRVEVD